MIHVMLKSCETGQRSEFLPEKRSFRIHGYSTTVRLERAFWTVLEDLAIRNQMPLATLITLVHDRCTLSAHNNFTSFLRVLSLKYINIYN